MPPAIPPAPSSPPPRAARRRRRLHGRLRAAVTLAAPALFILTADILRRAGYLVRVGRPHALGYLASFAASLVLWAVLLHAATRRRGSAAWIFAAGFVALFTAAAGLQGAFHALFRFYLGLDAELSLDSIPQVITGALPLTRPVVALHLAAALVVAALMVAAARRFVRPRRRWRRAARVAVPIVLYAAASMPASYHAVQSTTPDLIYFHGLAGGIREQLGLTEASRALFVERRSPEPVPPLARRPARPRNVLFVLQEAQRADVTCTAYDPACELATRASNRVVPGRLPLLAMRSNSSATAISLSNLWSGVRPNERREVLLGAPLLWEYAHAAGYHTAYWTSQHLMFGNSRLYVEDLPLDDLCSATDIDWQAEMFSGARDQALSDRVAARWGALPEPFFAVVHYSNIHTPRVYDPSFAPFQPAADSARPSPKDERYRAYYEDVVYLSDVAVASLLERVRASAVGARTVIVYTSDHGESYREHGQQSDHAASLYEEEIRVPAWIDAPAGTLSPDEEESLRRVRSEPVFHLDLATTILDLLGVWDDPGLAPFRARMIGRPLTRPERSAGPMPLTNASWVWESTMPSWGLMAGTRKIVARNFDTRWHCHDVASDPLELHDLGEAACAPLPDLALGELGGHAGAIPRFKQMDRERRGAEGRPEF